MDELAQLRVENSELQRQLQAANDRCAAAEARQQADAEALKLLKKAASESREKEAAAVKAEEGRLKAEQHVAAGWEARAGEYSRKIGELEQKLALARQGECAWLAPALCRRPTLCRLAQRLCSWFCCLRPCRLRGLATICPAASLPCRLGRPDHGQRNQDRLAPAASLGARLALPPRTGQAGVLSPVQVQCPCC